MTEKETTSYLDGYRDGHLDRFIGTYSAYGYGCFEPPGYSEGYRDGWNGRENAAMVALVRHVIASKEG